MGGCGADDADPSALATKRAWRHNHGMRDVIVTPQWQEFYDATGIPAAVRIGPTLRLTGHTGTRPDGSFSSDVAEQLRQTFANIADTLAAAGCTWADVEEITAFHVGLSAQGDLFLQVAAEFVSAPFPAWSAVGVVELYEPDAVVELRVVATIRSN
jgi:enamine deaminase RidA (YjgF/YER057c/UK114 family)